MARGRLETRVDGQLREGSFSVYKGEIGESELLTADEVVLLGIRIIMGVEAQKRLKKNVGVENGNRGRLEQYVQKGKEAEKVLVEANTRLVPFVQKKFFPEAYKVLSMADIAQIGNMGLMRAARKFDYRFGNKFSTYAVWWIRQMIGRELKRENKRDSGIVMSLDQPVGDDTDTTEGEMYEDREAITVEEMTEKIEMKEVAMEMLDKYIKDDRDHLILRLRFGFIDGEPWTLEDIGDYFGLSRERIRQLERRALRTLQYHAKKRKEKF